jgi:hypothetical protein
MEVTLALLADAANSTANNKLNVLGVFSNINPPIIPYTHPTMTLVVKFEADPVEANTKKTIQVVLLEPDGRELHRLEIEATLPPAGDAGHILEVVMQMALNGIKFERPGPHAFVVMVNGETKRRVPLNVSPASGLQEAPE